jgi:hypothetical protein
VTARPARLAAALLALSVPLAVAGCAGTDASDAATPSSTSPATSSSAPSSAPTDSGITQNSLRLEIEVVGGQVVDQPGRVPVTLGATVTLVITSDTPDEVHVHGYDLTAELVPGQPTELPFDATIPGVFEVELHETGTVLLTLQVQ